MYIANCTLDPESESEQLRLYSESVATQVFGLFRYSSDNHKPRGLHAMLRIVYRGFEFLIGFTQVKQTVHVYRTN